MTSPPGLDLERLTAWWATAPLPEPGGPLSAELVAGGKSNLTYVVTDGTASWVVRRPPLGHVLATAHDMAREYRVISALRDTAVPVPATYALCRDEDVLGAPFYVMERVEGRPYRRAAELAPLGPRRTRTIAEGLVDTLAALHAVDPAAVGLADFGRPRGYLERQVRRWKKQLDASRSRDLPAADELHALLAADVPAETAASIVHGDFRLDNVLVDASDTVTAVLDWEMATLGDPLADLALLLIYHRAGEAITDVAAAPGFPTEDEIVARYTAHGGREVSRFGFHLGLAAFKLAVISEGIHYRHLHGQTVGPGFERVGDTVHAVLDIGLTAVKEYR